jgi:ADP-heptose:LPS heptosyltransferase
MSGCYAAFHKQLGDLVLLEPALARLRDHHGAPVRLFTRGGHAAVVELMPGIKFMTGLPIMPLADFYCFDPLSKSAFRSIATPVLRRHLIVPERRELRWFHRFLFARPTAPELGDTYVAEFFWMNTPVASTTAFRPPRLSRPPGDWSPGQLTPRSFLLVNATSGWRRKLWTPAGWAQTIASLAPDTRIILTSGAQDWQNLHCEEIASLTGGRAQIARTTLRQFLWTCANASAVLTVDGAASHLAAAFDTPVLTLFGPTNPSNWNRPAPRNVAIAHDQTGTRIDNLKNLDAGPVIEAARQLLAPTR